jgi:hypothetical protein
MRRITATLLSLCVFINALWADVDPASKYTRKMNDPEAVYFTSENFTIKNDGTKDVSDELQKAINTLKQEQNFGVVFIPTGQYMITKTIYVPKAIRLIGYGPERPEFILAPGSPGFDKEVSSDKGKSKYMFWYTSRIVQDESNVPDATAGTFYSGFTNINITIKEGNPHAIALRTHFAQHSFVSHCIINIGSGKAGLFDVGNEMENVAFYGGQYGIITTKTSPSWPMMMTDTYFEGQKTAAINTQEAALTIVRLQAVNVPTVIEVNKNYFDKLYLEDCYFKNISNSALIISNDLNHNNHLTVINTVCENVPTFATFMKSKETIGGSANTYVVNKLTQGVHLNQMGASPIVETRTDIKPLDKMPEMFKTDIPALPEADTWINIADLGAVGDGKTDNTKIFKQAIEKYANIYVPQGRYIVSETIKLKKNTCLIGMHPMGTQIRLIESSPNFSGFGSPKPVIETEQGGHTILSGIGINTGAYNYRAVGCKWQAGEKSYMNDVKYVGGHGTMRKGPAEGGHRKRDTRISTPEEPVYYKGMDKAWDNQYWSLWVTNNGGGILKNIWTASSYSANGLYVSNTSTPGKIYAMSIEHHLRNEVRFNKVKNWSMYAFQLEEEGIEGVDCLPIELNKCEDLNFANLYLFRTIRVVKPFPYGIRTSDCKNINFHNVHNFAQVRLAMDLTMIDFNTERDVRPWEITHLTITGKEQRLSPLQIEKGKVVKLADGFEFAQGITSDSKGNIYFCEKRLKRIYKWDAETNTIGIFADYPFKPLSLATDTEDNLLVIFRYDPQPGYLVDGKQETIPVLSDAGGTSYSAWGNSGFATWVYAVDPDNPDETITKLERVPMGSISNLAKVIYPSHRWRDNHDFEQALQFVPEKCFVAPDGVTIIPEQYDLARAASVTEAVPGEVIYNSDEFFKRVVTTRVRSNGTLTNPKHFAEQAEFDTSVDADDNVYIADGHIYVYDKNGKLKNEIRVPKRPSSITFGGTNNDILFITARSGFYAVKI